MGMQQRRHNVLPFYIEWFKNVQTKHHTASQYASQHLHGGVNHVRKPFSKQTLRVLFIRKCPNL